MKLLALLMPVLSIVAMVAFIWLTVVAFRRSTLWGFLVLLLSPFSAVIFAIKYWQESKKPFLIYAGSIAGCLAIVVSMFAFLGGFTMMAMAEASERGELTDEQVVEFIGDTMDKMERSGLLDDQEQAELQEFRKTFDEMTAQQRAASTGAPQVAVEPIAPSLEAETATAAITKLNVRAEPAPQAIPATIAPGGIIPLRDASDYIGKFLEVQLRDGHEYQGRLAAFDAEGLRLDRHLPSGVIAIHVPRRDIRTLRMAKRTTR